MNLKRFVDDLTAWGMTQAEIGKAIGRSQPVISEIQRKNPSRPSYETAAKLKQLHAQKLKERKAA